MKSNPVQETFFWLLLKPATLQPVVALIVKKDKQFMHFSIAFNKEEFDIHFHLLKERGTNMCRIEANAWARN